MGDEASSNGSAIGALAPAPSPHLEFSSDDSNTDDGLLTGKEQVVISVVACSTALIFLLAVLVVALVKLAQFIRSSQNFKDFMEDAAKAEFSRNNGNPLYSPDHTPIQLPAHIIDRDLDLKPSLPCPHGVAVSHSTSCNNVSQVLQKTGQQPTPSQRQNGNCDNHTGGLETQECGNRSLEIQEYRNESTGIAVDIADHERKNCPSCPIQSPK